MKQLISLAALFAILSTTAWAGKAPKETPQLLAQGKAAYALNCAACHGEKGDGNGPAGKVLNPKPRNFGTDKLKAGDSVEALFATITNGLPKTNMTAYKHLSEQDRWAIAYYVKSMRLKKK